MAITAAKQQTDIELTKETPYLALTGEIWGVYYDTFRENWPRYNGIVLYIYFTGSSVLFLQNLIHNPPWVGH